MLFLKLPGVLESQAAGQTRVLPAPFPAARGRYRAVCLGRARALPLRLGHWRKLGTPPFCCQGLHLAALCVARAREAVVVGPPSPSDWSSSAVGVGILVCRHFSLYLCPCDVAAPPSVSPFSRNQPTPLAADQGSFWGPTVSPGSGAEQLPTVPRCHGVFRGGYPTF